MVNISEKNVNFFPESIFFGLKSVKRVEILICEYVFNVFNLSLYNLSRARRELVLKTFRQQLFRGIIRLKSHLYSKSVGRFRSLQLTI